MDRSYCPVQGQSDRNMEKPGLERIIYREIYCSRYVGIQARGCSVCARKRSSVKSEKKSGKDRKVDLLVFFSCRKCQSLFHSHSLQDRSEKEFQTACRSVISMLLGHITEEIKYSYKIFLIAYIAH